MAHVVPIVHAWLFLVLVLCVLPASAPTGAEIPHLDKLVHAMMYAMPACMLAFTGRINLRWIVWLVLFGIAIEIIQSFLSYRSGDIYDACANTSGVLVGWLAGVKIRQRVRNRQ